MGYLTIKFERHAFAVTSIDKATGIATVENPWDTSKPTKISVKDLASFGYLNYLPPPDAATVAAQARVNAAAGATAAAQADADATLQKGIAAGETVSSETAHAAAKAARADATAAAKASDKASKAAAKPGAGPEAALAKTAAAKSAAHAHHEAIEAEKLHAAVAADENNSSTTGSAI